MALTTSIWSRIPELSRWQVGGEPGWGVPEGGGPDTGCRAAACRGYLGGSAWSVPSCIWRVQLDGVHGASVPSQTGGGHLELNGGLTSCRATLWTWLEGRLDGQRWRRRRLPASAGRFKQTGLQSDGASRGEGNGSAHIDPAPGVGVAALSPRWTVGSVTRLQSTFALPAPSSQLSKPWRLPSCAGLFSLAQNISSSKSDGQWGFGPSADLRLVWMDPMRNGFASWVISNYWDLCFWVLWIWWQWTWLRFPYHRATGFTFLNQHYYLFYHSFWFSADACTL